MKGCCIWLFCCQCIHTFLIAGDDEVTFDPGDIINNVEMVDDGWWLGEVNGKRGLFPSNYAELV